jgi:hypothetical protein
MSGFTGKAQKTPKSEGGGTPTGFGLGLRLGDPTGITLKKYFGGNKAIEFNVGRTYNFQTYDRDRFYRYGTWNKKGYIVDDTYFRRSRSLAFQLHYLVHKDIRLLPGLRWYIGFGGQVRTTTYYYYYRYAYTDDERYTRVNVGLDGIIGLEYTFKDVPISVFLDANIYLEVVDDPFALDGQGGIGARYNF